MPHGPTCKRRVVLVPFPFSDLTQAKLRPAVVLAAAERGDWILCQVTSKPYADSRAIELDGRDFARGGLQTVSYARPAKPFTAHESLFVTTAGMLRSEPMARITATIVALIQGPA